MYEYKSNPSLNDDFKETENHYFDTSCQKCGHVPQGETHLCGWEHDGTLHFRKLEHMQKPLTAEQVLKGTEPNELTAIMDMETPKENWIEELHKLWTDKTALIEIEELIESLLLTQRQEIVDMTKGMKKDRNIIYDGVSGDNQGLFVLFYNLALSDLSERITKNI
jgi:hypothetical protein